MAAAAAFLGRHRQLEKAPANGEGDDISGGSGGGGAGGVLRSSGDSGSGCGSPKRVSFAPTPPALRTGSGSTGSLLELSGSSPRLRRTRSVAAAEAEAAAALAAADGGLLFIPEVDSPRHRRHLFSPMNAPPLCRRWPSNEVRGELLPASACLPACLRCGPVAPPAPSPTLPPRTSAPRLILPLPPLLWAPVPSPAAAGPGRVC